MGKMYVNLLHRVRTGEDLIRGFKFQQKTAHDRGFKTTITIPYSSMFDKDVIEMVKKDHEEFGDELAIWLGEWECDEFEKISDTQDEMFHLLPTEMKKTVAKGHIDRFKEVFGMEPKSVGAYYLDASSLKIVKEICPNVTGAIATCYEEGVNMYHGCNFSWHLLNDGGPWSAWIPSKKNSLCPAKDEDDDIGIVAMPHLTRDPILSVHSRNDFYASHPPNILRGKVYDGPDTTYHLNFIDQWIVQGVRLNKSVYYNMHVSVPWIVYSNHFEEDPSISHRLYEEALQLLKERADQGYVEAMTMSEYAQWHRKNITYDDTEYCQWQDVLMGTGREYLNVINNSLRATVSLSNGCTIIDLRPYAGQFESSTGSDEDGLWWGSYPYLMYATHRDGGNAFVYCTSAFAITLHCGEHELNLDQTKMEGEIVRTDNGDELRVKDFEVEVGDVKLRLGLVVSFDKEHKIHYSMELKETSREDLPVLVSYEVSANPGKSEYPEDGRGITLELTNGKEKETMVTRYAGKMKRMPGATEAKAIVPQVNSVLSLKAESEAKEGFIGDEHLFSPFFDLGIQSEIKKGERAKVCLTIKSI